MDKPGAMILAELQAVAQQRSLRAADSALANSVLAVKAFQHLRFSKTYSDMLASPRYGPAARFFLADLYGPQDYSERDVQFARVVPLLVRMLPKELLQTLVALARLHALSEQLDTGMAQALMQRLAPVQRGTSGGNKLDLDYDRYADAWRTASTVSERERQIDLTVQVGRALERYTNKPLLRHSLSIMRAPAQAAGLGALQRFLEVGFDTFKKMNGAAEFLGAIEVRERAHATALFSGASAAPDLTNWAPP